MRFLNEKVLDAVIVSADRTTAAIDASQLYAASIQAVIPSGTATGTLTIQFSNDAPGPAAPANWSTITGASVAVGAAGTFIIVKTDLCYRWIRVKYTDGSSGAATGALTVMLQAQGF